MREQAKTPEGMLSEAGDGGQRRCCRVLCTRLVLVGLAPRVHEGRRLEALHSRKPDLYTSLSNSVGLSKLAGKYEAAIRKVAPSFYTPSLAEQASRRVEI